MTAERRAYLERELFKQNQILDDFKSGQFREVVQAENELTGEMLATIRHFERTGKLPNGKTPAEQAQEYFKKSEYYRELSQQNAQEYAEKQKSVEQERKQREHLAMLGRLSPPVWQLTAQYRQAQREQAELREQFRQPAPRERKFAVPARHDTLDVLLHKTDDVLAEFQAAIDELWLNHDFEF